MKRISSIVFCLMVILSVCSCNGQVEPTPVPTLPPTEASTEQAAVEPETPVPSPTVDPRAEALAQYGFLQNYLYNERVQDFILGKDVERILIGHYTDNESNDWDFVNRLVFTIRETDSLESFLPDYYPLIEDYKEIAEADMAVEAEESLEQYGRYLIYGQSNSLGSVIAVDILPSEQKETYTVELSVRYDGVYESYWRFIQTQWIPEILPYGSLSDNTLQKYVDSFSSHDREVIATFGDEATTQANAILFELPDDEYQNIKSLLLSDDAMGFYGDDINFTQEDGFTSLNYDVGDIRCIVDMRDEHRQITLSLFSFGLTDFSKVEVQK